MTTHHHEAQAGPSGLNGRWKYSKLAAALVAGLASGATAYFGAHSAAAGIVALVVPPLLTALAPANRQ